MKNINSIKIFMRENSITFDEDFYVDFGEKQETFNIDNLKKFVIVQEEDNIYFNNDSGEEITYEEIGNIIFNEEVHVITKEYFEKMMKYYISISKLCNEFDNNKTECIKCPVYERYNGCFFVESYRPNGIVEHLGDLDKLILPRCYKYKGRLLHEYKNYKELIDNVN